MAQLLPFGEYRPDLSDLNMDYTARLANVLPRADGYGPFHAINPVTGPLAARCRGFFFARRQDGTVAIFAGTSNKLYLLDNTTLTWTDVSLGAGTYTALAPTANWVFAQFGAVVIATQKNAVMQSFTLGTSSAFGNLGGSPPQAGWISVVGPFVVACDLLSNQYRVHWSGLNAITTWTAGVSLSDFQDLPYGGRPRCIGKMAGDVGLIIQEGAVRRMMFAPGSDVVFQIDVLKDDLGTYAPYSLCTASGRAFFFSTRGFTVMSASGEEELIGEEKVDRTVLGDWDNSAESLFLGATDPAKNLALWAYKSLNGASDQFDKIIAYHWALKRWAPVTLSGEYIAALSSPGLTLEGLDAVAPGVQTITNVVDGGAGVPHVTVGSTAGWTTGDYKTISGVVGTTEVNGTWLITVVNGTTIALSGVAFVNAYVSGGIVGGSLDALTFSLDDVSTATLPAIAAVDTAHKIGLFSGATLEAVLETPEQSLDDGRLEVNGLRPITDAGTVYCSVRKRDNLNAVFTDGDESAMDDDGNCPVLEESRYARGKQRIPSGTDWTFAKGIAPDVRPAGEF